MEEVFYSEKVLTVYEEEQVKKIMEWKSEMPSVFAKSVEITTRPFVRLVERVVPEAAIKGVLDLSNIAAQCFTDTYSIKKEAGVKNIRSLKEGELKICDQLAEDVHKWAIGISIAEGSSSGIFGVFGVAVDIPAVITMALRTIYKVGACYGYECKTQMDQNFILGIMAASGANSIEEKLAAVSALNILEVESVKQCWDHERKKVAREYFAKESVLSVTRNLARQLGINITKRKALATIPIIGAAIGGTANGWYIKEVGLAARRIFQERWLMDKGKISEAELTSEYTS